MSNKKLTQQELLDTETRDCIILFSIPLIFVLTLLILGLIIKFFSS